MTQTIPLQAANTFSKTFLDYVAEDPQLSPFYGLAPKIENFAEQIEKKNFPESKRQILFDVLNDQYKEVKTSEEVWKNINSLLKTNTYTITTGHQLNIFGGPLYFIYKIITTINTAKELNKKYSDHHFIPVYWMASEDHDFEEINNFNFSGKNWKWETQQKGAVGRFSLDGMEALLNAIPEKVSLFEKAYKEHKTLAEATRYFVNELFGEDGLLIIDADNKTLKKQFSEIVKEEILNKSAYTLVQKTSSQLEAIGYEAQVHAREINLFYLENNLRERIIPNGENYKVNNTEISFSKEEIVKKIDDKPEEFSPNVILRPLFQECILPNLAYIGGPAEVVYWLQLKNVFEHYKVPFPILMPRNFALYINKTAQTKLSKLSIDIQELFLQQDQLKNNFLTKISGSEFKLGQEQEKIKELYSGIKEKAIAIDKTMEGAVMAELQKSVKILEELEKRLRKAEERKNETAITQLLSVKEKLFPGGGLQERSDNFLNFYLSNTDFITTIKNTFEPFNYKFYLLNEHE